MTAKLQPSPSVQARWSVVSTRLAPWCIWILFALLFLRALFAVSSDAGRGWDFATYYRAGTLLVGGHAQELYAVRAPTSVSGLPISSLVLVPLGFLEERDALLLFKIQSALFLAVALFLLYPYVRARVSNWIQPNLILSVYLLIALLYAPIWFVFEVGGQLTPLALFCLVLFHRFYLEERVVAAALLLSLAILFKPFLGAAVLIFILARDVRFLKYLVLFLAAEIAASLLLFGWHLHLDWLITVSQLARGWTAPWWNNAAIWGVLNELWFGIQGLEANPEGPEPTLLLGITLALQLLLVLLFWRLVREIKQAQTSAEQRDFLVMLAIWFSLFLPSLIWPHYLAFLIIPLAFVLVRMPMLSRAGQLLMLLVLLSTLSVESRFAQRFVLALFLTVPVAQSFVAGVFGSGTLILCLLFLVFYHKELVQIPNESSYSYIP
ncbi:MAG TPA: glycosyltransferase 87 family protein [Anaerolineae bacterium]|nr:glycosyltransferase 87 family protein [Anaerolineae bacterium]